jgi:hypothetical protein
MSQSNSKPPAGHQQPPTGRVQREYLQSVTDRQAQTRERLGWAAPKPPVWAPQSVPPQETT